MPNLKKTISLKSIFIKSIFGFTLLMLLLIIGITANKVHQQQNKTLEQHTILWANFLAQKSIPFLQNNTNKTHIELNKALKQYITTPLINRIHIYQHNTNGSNNFFTSYNKNHNFPAIKDKTDDITKLTSVNYQDNFVELIVEINNEQQTLGYLYIQFSLNEKNSFFNDLIITLFTLALLILVISLLLAQWLHKKVNTPIIHIVENVSEISQSKQYQNKVSYQNYKEYDLLVRNINGLLARIFKHINSIENAHQYTLEQNDKLKSRVDSRTDALKESNQELLSTLEKLHQFQGQLVETEKMASLGDMVAGMAHEINTPIGLGVTASSLLGDKHSEIKQAFINKTLKSSQLNKFLTDGEENISIILRNLERAAKLISSFKKVAVDQSSAESRAFNVNELLNEVILTLSAKLKSAQVSVSLNCPKDLNITSKPGPINQILINLILNSIYHAFEEKGHGEITIRVMVLSDQLHITYSDNGVGIDEKVKNKIFDPFTTTKRGTGGSGLGMHLVYNLVTQALDGNIQMESEKNNGVYFDVTFPVEINLND